MDKISIITITYNNAKALEQTIRSVCMLNYPDKEYIVIDGGSNDDTPSVLKRYADCIDICVSEPDDGIYDALNKGVKKAAGEWIICMNAGDVFATGDVLERIFSEDIPTDARFIYSDSIIEFSDGSTLLRIMDRNKGNIHHQCSIYKRSLHEDYGYYIVTHPYTVSDLMFFLSIPEKYYYKTKTIISVASFGGVSSQGIWCPLAALSLKHVYGINGLARTYYEQTKIRIKWLAKKILRIEHK